MNPVSSSSSCGRCCISHEFSISCSKNPNKIAVIHSHPQPHRVYKDDICFTYSEISEAIDSLSRRIRFTLSAGSFSSTTTPRTVGIYMLPSVEYIISVFSVLRCGEAFMPLDPSWPKQRVLSLLSSSAPNLVLCASTSFDTHHSETYDWITGCPVLVISMKAILNFQSVSPSLLWPCQSNMSRPFCYLMYTSGSTGKPKGVCGTEQGLLNRFLWMQDMYPLCGDENLLFKTSIGFIDHLQEFFGALLTGCTLVIPSFSVLKQNIFSITDYIKDYSINRLVAVPSLMRVLLPTLQSSVGLMILTSLKLLILSGEILDLSLWNSLSELLPNKTILNLYGSTEVSGDCTYFDCKRLSSIMETESLSTVPIGIPIPNCEVSLVGEDAPNYGEIYVSGLCNAMGYFNQDVIPLKAVKKLPESSFCCSDDEKKSQLYFKTSDFAKQLPSGDLVFVGRNDRTVKVNGIRLALEEIENTIREYEDVDAAAVIYKSDEGEIAYLDAYIVTKVGHACVESLRCSLRGWMGDKLPLVMIPNHFFFVDSIPVSSSGKVDYTSLASLRCSVTDFCTEINKVTDGDLLLTIKEAFCDALMLKNLDANDDFFAMGGDSISAAHTCHKLGINMKLMYAFPTPLRLVMALLDPKISVHPNVGMDVPGGTPQFSIDTDKKINKPRGRLSSKLGVPDADYHPLKVSRVGGGLNVDKTTSFAISRCNNVTFGESYDNHRSFQATIGDKKASIRKLWNVHMESCVDASPLVVVRENEIFVFIGSHSHKFKCIKSPSGDVQWEVQLDGRVECTAAILGDFSEVIVGCYKGNIYFLNSLNGSIRWTFKTGGEVKSQPVVDNQRHLVWCGSYDHNLYALDYQSYSCVYKLHCGGSIYGSPVINEFDERLYFASTSGYMTALSLKVVPFSVLWKQDLGAPVFGSLSIGHLNGNVICCLVNGHIIAVDANGSIVWRGITGAPIFAGPCLSRVLDDQVVICSRDGGVYSFGLEKGNLLWKHDLGAPISSSAYIDENLQLISDYSVALSDRLICVCTSSGCIVVLRIGLLDAVKKTAPLEKYAVQEFGKLDIQGAIFSSPVMIGGTIFVGCRDDYVHCLKIEDQTQINQ